MRITEDAREYAEEQWISENKAIESGMEERILWKKALKFARKHNGSLISRAGVLLAGHLLILASVSSVLAAETADNTLSKLVVPLDPASAKTEAAQKFLAEKLGSVAQKTNGHPQVLITDDKRYIVYGDLFGTGEQYAMAQVPQEPDAPSELSRVAFACWHDRKWKLTGLWEISCIWRPKEWKKTDDDPLPIKPTDRPFELQDFTGDGVPEVIVAGEVWRYYQQHYLLRFNPKAHGLRLLQDAMAKPELVGGYLRLYFNSGHQAIFEEWHFLRWSGEEFIPKVSWHAESPYNNVDPSFVKAEISGPDGKAEKLLITRGAEQEFDHDSIHVITRDGNDYGEVHFSWRESLTNSPVENWDKMEEAWLFEKLTGLPRKLLPHGDSAKPLARFEDHGKVRVTGSKEALQRLGAGANR